MVRRKRYITAHTYTSYCLSVLLLLSATVAGGVVKRPAREYDTTGDSMVRDSRMRCKRLNPDAGSGAYDPYQFLFDKPEAEWYMLRTTRPPLYAGESSEDTVPLRGQVENAEHISGFFRDTGQTRFLGQ